MPKYTITYCDEIEAKDEIEAYAILLAQLASDVKNEDVSGALTISLNIRVVSIPPNTTPAS